MSKIRHFGDIQKLSGAELPIVDIITGGSPCQDLSVAGKRAGLDGERSGLFMDQVRVVKEMREHDRQQLHSRGADVDIRLRGLRPRFLVWENVPGALSSGKPKGADFQIVLTEIVKIVKADAVDVPLPKDGKWAKAGLLYGVGDDGLPFSVAWRIHDAQYHGVAQRRKRLCLLADFNGHSAGEILFDPQFRRETEDSESNLSERYFGRERRSEVQPESESLPRDLDESREKGETVATDSEGSTGESDSIWLDSELFGDIE